MLIVTRLQFFSSLRAAGAAIQGLLKGQKNQPLDCHGSREPRNDVSGFHLHLTAFLLFSLFVPLPAYAYSPLEIGTWGAISILLAIIPASIAFLMYHRWRQAEQRIEYMQPLYAHKAYTNSAVTEGYCYWNLQTNAMEISTTLKHIFHLHPPSDDTLTGVIKSFKRDDAERLQEAIDTLRDITSYYRKIKLTVPLRTNVLSDTSKNDFLLEIETENDPITMTHARYFEVLGNSVTDREGAYTGIIIWFRDISETKRYRKRLELENEQLKEEVHSLSNILNAAPFPIWQRDKDLNISYYNLTYGQYLQDPMDHYGDLESLELGKYGSSLAHKAQTSGAIVRDDYHIIVKGQRRLYEVIEVPNPDNGTIAGFAYDVTYREELEHEIKRHLSAQSDFLESSASAMAVYGFDTRLQHYNNAFLKLSGLDDQWLSSKPTYGEVLEAMREKRKLPEQANFPEFKRQHLQFFKTLIEPHNEFFYLPDGTALRVIVIPHALGGLLFAYEDMTDRLAIERSYNTLIAVQRATLDNLREGVALFGQNGRIKLSNPAYTTLWEIAPDQLKGEPHISQILEHTKHLYYHDGDWIEFKEHIIAQTTNQQHFKQRLERTDGKVLDWICVTLPDGAILMTYVDVTDSTLVERSLRERNEALEAADHLKTEFLANVSYELRSPLTSIIGFSEILKDHHIANMTSKQVEYIQGIHSSSLYLMALINDILDLASIEAGYMRLEVGRFNLYNTLLSVVPLISERLRENSLGFELECDPQIGDMDGDERRIKQLLFKLLSNAIKFTEPQGVIILSAHAVDNYEIAITVSDTGIGIPTDEQDVIFEKFYKSEASKASNKPGAGLGLSVVKNFVELHKGRIEVDSTMGVGTRITCIFKRQNPELFASTSQPRAIESVNG